MRSFTSNALYAKYVCVHLQSIICEFTLMSIKLADVDGRIFKFYLKKALNLKI